MKKTEIVDFLWERGYFEEYRKPKAIAKLIWNDFKIEPGNITMFLKSKAYLKRFSEGWRQIRPAFNKKIVQTEDLEEISNLLEIRFEKEISELKIALSHQPDCTAFLLRKILEKLLFIIISKSSNKSKIDKIVEIRGNLPTLTELLNIAKNTNINNEHIISPKNIDKLSGSKFLGDTSAHDYLANVSFEDIKQEISIWRISIKQLAFNLK